MNNDLISRSALQKRIINSCVLPIKGFGFAISCHAVDFIIESAPAVVAEPVRHGRWIDDHTNIICSECKAEYSDEIVFMNRDCENADLSYCPNCGAKMVAEVEG